MFKAATNTVRKDNSERGRKPVDGLKSVPKPVVLLEHWLRNSVQNVVIMEVECVMLDTACQGKDDMAMSEPDGTNATAQRSLKSRTIGKHSSVRRLVAEILVFDDTDDAATGGGLAIELSD